MSGKQAIQVQPMENFWDSLSQDEGDSAKQIIKQLADVRWAQPLIKSIHENGGVTQANKDRLFELRFGYALHEAGVVTPQYEINGEGGSTIDFGFISRGQRWAVELLRLGETQAVKAATVTYVDEDDIPWTKRVLTTTAADPKQSPEGETLKAVQRICQKFEASGKPHKFLMPQDALHAILVDFRTFMNGGDVHVALGGEYVAQQYRLFWDKQVITGVFHKGTQVKGAAEARERVHFLGFTCEKTYKSGEFPQVTQFIANRYLFSDAAAVRTAIQTWPLQPTEVLNARD